MNGHFERFGDLPMRTAIATFVRPAEDRLRFIRQLGVRDVILWGTTFGEPTGTRRDEIDAGELSEMRRQIEAHGHRLFAVETLPAPWYDRIITGAEGWREQIAHFQNSIRAVAAAGVPVLGYNWVLHGVWRTSYTAELRGGARGTAFHADDVRNLGLTHGREFVEADFWRNYERFLEAVLPVAEREGVLLTLHPNDPPVEQVGGVPFLFRDRASFQRAMDLGSSRYHGLTLCLGCWSEMGEDIPDVVRHFGAQGKIAYVHFQAVRGSVPCFHETFVDEGDYGGFDAWQVLQTLQEVGFRGVMIPGHVPQMEGDIEWRTGESYSGTPYQHPMGGYRARAFTIGYLRGMLRALDEDRPS
jgi:mannonate dehydratase